MVTEFSPIESSLGGLLIGISVILMFFFNGRITGISGMFHGVLLRERLIDNGLFLLGILLGAIVFKSLTEGSLVFRQDFPLLPLCLAGLLVGFGTKLGSGCTSGHGICGISRLSKRSILATLVFMTLGFISVGLIRHVF